MQGPPKRSGGGQTSPRLTSPPVFSPPPLSEGATPGKSNLKHGSQQRKQTLSESDSSSTLLPEIPTIEVLSASVTEEGGGGGGGGKTPVKVRFADEVEAEERQSAKAEEREGSKVKAEDGKVPIKAVEEKEREVIEMDSVDFDKVTGTSTPITEDSPNLSKQHDDKTSSAGQSLGSVATSLSSSTEEEREDVLTTAAERVSPREEMSEPSNRGISESHTQGERAGQSLGGGADHGGEERESVVVAAVGEKVSAQGETSKRDALEPDTQGVRETDAGPSSGTQADSVTVESDICTSEATGQS